MVARTLTQHAVPTTFGLKVATWLTGVLDAWDDLDRADLPRAGSAAPPAPGRRRRARATTRPRRGPALADALGLADVAALAHHPAPGHPDRRRRWSPAPTPGAGSPDDVLTLSRPEIGELAEGVGGGSSTMPHKANPVLSMLVRRAALTTPQLAATLHLAAAEQVDERADGAWHVEWATLATLVRRTAGRRRRRPPTWSTSCGCTPTGWPPPWPPPATTCWPSSAPWPSSPGTNPPATTSAPPASWSTPCSPAPAIPTLEESA